MERGVLRHTLVRCRVGGLGWLCSVGVLGLALSQAAMAVEWPLRLNADGYLEDSSGVPFLVVGDAAWPITTVMSPSDVVEYMDDRADKGFSAVLVAATVHYPALGPRNYAGQLPFPNGNDWSVRNESYWSHVDYILSQAKDRGIAVFFAPAYAGFECNDEGWCEEMIAQTNSAMSGFGTWIANRYKGYGNIIWVNGGDVDCGNHPGLCDRVDAIANAIRAADPTALQTAHSGRTKSALDDYNRPWLNVNTTYTDCDSYYTAIQRDYQRTNALPFLFIEGNYEFLGADMTCLLGQAMSAYLGGALIGHFYGNDNIVENPSSWQGSAGTDSPGSRAMSNVAKLLRSRVWWKFVPDYDNVVVTSSKGSGVNYKETARTSDHATALVWLPQAGSVTVNLAEISGSQARAWWWNSSNNAVSEIGVFPTTGLQSFSSPTGRMVLVIDDVAANSGPPGSAGPSPSVPKPPTNLTVR